MIFSNLEISDVDKNAINGSRAKICRHDSISDVLVFGFTILHYFLNNTAKKSQNRSKMTIDEISYSGICKFSFALMKNVASVTYSLNILVIYSPAAAKYDPYKSL